jgi:acyl carrier protein
MDDSRFSDVGVDSADMITVIYDLESEFNIVISDEEMGGISTIQEACNLISDKINKT